MLLLQVIEEGARRETGTSRASSESERGEESCGWSKLESSASAKTTKGELGSKHLQPEKGPNSFCYFGDGVVGRAVLQADGILLGQIGWKC
jgi:hypothetical protein